MFSYTLARSAALIPRDKNGGIFAIKSRRLSYDLKNSGKLIRKVKCLLSVPPRSASKLD